MLRLVIRNLVIAGLCVLGFALFYDRVKGRANRARWETSPCGTKLFYDGYVLGDHYYSSRGADPADYKDDGVRVWKIKSVYFKNFNPHTKMAQMPEVEWQVVMERTPQACQAWIERTGINLAKK